MYKNFKYDVVKLITCVRNRPWLWDKTLENYKDRVERRTAWEEIFCALDDGYEAMTWEEKRITGELILNKWTNIRDTFIKTLKNKMGKPKKRYLYHRYLQFLIKVVPVEECNLEYLNDEIPAYMKQETVSEEGSGYGTRKNKKPEYITGDNPPDDDAEDSTYIPPKKTRKSGNELAKKSKSQETDNDLESFSYTADNYVEVNESDPRVMNEDEAFFASLLPTVVKYSEDDRLEFRMEVLNVMKKIREKKKLPGDD